MHCNDVELRYFSRLSGRALILCLAAYASAMLNSISRLGETRPEQERSNGTEFSGYSDFPEKRVHSKRIPKFSKTFPGIFTVPFSFGPEISEFLAEWKAPPGVWGLLGDFFLPLPKLKHRHARRARVIFLVKRL